MGTVACFRVSQAIHSQARGTERGKGISYLQKSVKCCITLSRLSLILFKLEGKLTC